MNEQYIKQTSFKSALTDITTMAYRNLLKTKHNPEKLFDVTVVPVLFMIMFSFLFGGAIAGDVKSYLPIIVPGVLVQTLVGTSAIAGTQLREDMETGVFDRFNSLPIIRIAPLAGLLLSDVVRYTIAAVLSLATGYIIGWRPEQGFGYVLLATLIIIFACWAISWIFATLGLMFKSSATIQGISMMVTMLLSFVSSAFVPIDTLPSGLQFIASINPVTHLIEAFKSLAYNGVIGQDVTMALFSSIVIVAIFLPLTIVLYRKNVQ